MCDVSVSRVPSCALTAQAPEKGTLRVATWNIAAINNNPFEYWITHDDADYNALMEGVQSFIDQPGAPTLAPPWPTSHPRPTATLASPRPARCAPTTLAPAATLTSPLPRLASTRPARCAAATY